MAEGMRRGFPGALLAVLLVVAAVSSATAAPALHRGINFELWQTWTNRTAFLASDYDRGNFPDWMNRVDDGQLAALRRQGFDFVRLNVDPSPFLWDDAGAGKLTARVVVATKRLQALGFTVIVDLHLVPDMDDRPDGLHTVLGTGDVREPVDFPRYLALVGRMARAVRELPPERTLLELMNEPDQDWFSPMRLLDRWPGQLAALYHAARDAAPGLAVVLSGARGGGVDGLTRLDPSAYAGDDGVVWSFHLYEPYEITHSGLPWERDAGHFLTGLPFPAAALDDAAAERLLAEAETRIAAEIGDAAARDKLRSDVRQRLAAYKASGADAQTLRAETDRVAAWARRYEIPPSRIVMGEFGVFQNHVAPATRAAIIAATREAAEADGFSWAIYTAGLTQAGQSFAVVGDAATLAVEPAIADALGLPPPASP